MGGTHQTFNNGKDGNKSEGAVVSKKWYNPVFNGIKKGVQKHSKKVDLAITLSLGFFSLPLAWGYLGVRKPFDKISSTISGVLAGIGCTALLFVGSNLYINRNIDKLDFGDVVVTHNLERKNINKYTPAKLEYVKDYFLNFVTNYGVVNMLSDSYDQKKTNVTVKTLDGKDKIEAKYKIDGFQDLNYLRNNGLPIPNGITLNGHDVKGEFGTQSYDGLCKKVFECEKEHF